MLNHARVAATTAFCESRHPVNNLNRCARAGTHPTQYAIAPLRLEANASHAEATFLLQRQTSLSPSYTSLQTNDASVQPLPKWLQDAADPRKTFKPPTSTRDSSASNNHVCYSNKDLDKLIYSIAHNPSTSSRLPVLHRWLLDVDHAFDSRLCTTLISSFVQLSQPAAALNVFFWMKDEVRKGREELRPTVHTYTAAIQAATAARTFTQASLIWKDVQGARIRSDERLTCTYMAALFQASYYSQVLQLFDSLHDGPNTPPAQAYVLAIRAQTKMGNSGEALELWDEMQERLQPDSIGYGYSAAIAACAHARDSQLAHTIFSSMTRRGIQPDCVSCTSLMHAYASTGAWRAAEALLQKMQQLGVQPRAQTFTGLMASYGASAELGRALGLWRAMRSPEWRGPAADAHILAVLLKAVGRGDASRGASVEVAEALFTEATAEMPAADRSGEPLPRADVAGLPEAVMAREWGQRTEEGFCAACELFGVAADGAVLDGAKQAIVEDEAGERSFAAAPGVGTEQPGARWAWNGAQRRAATAILPSSGSEAAGVANMQQAQSRHAGAAQQVDRMISKEGAFAAAAGDSARAAEELREKRLDAEAAAELVRDLTGRGQPRGQPRGPRQKGCTVVNDVVCVALMMTYSRAARWRECMAVIGRAQELGVAPTSQMFNVAMYAAACAKQPHVAEALFDSISGESWRVSWETLMFAYSRCGMHCEAEAVVAHMQASNIPLRDYVAVALIQAYSEAGQWRLSLRIEKRLRRLGIKPTVHVLNALLTVCVRYHVYDRGVKLLTEFRTRDSPNRTRVTELLARAVCQEEVSTIETQQVLATALSGVAAAVGGALIRSGLF